MPLAQLPKKPVGRPRKYTKEAAAEAKRASNQRSRQRKRLLHPARPTDFIAYEPAHPNVPNNTPASGLRISTDIPIPAEDDVQETTSNQNLRPIFLLPMPSPDEAITAHISEIQQNERASNPERDEYEAEIAHQLIIMEAEAVESLIQMAGTKVLRQDKDADGLAVLERQTTNDTPMLEEGEEICNEEPLNFCFPAVAIDESILFQGDNDDIDASDTSNIAENIPRSQENLLPPHTPIQQQTQTTSISSSNSKTKNANRRSTSFP